MNTLTQIRTKAADYAALQGDLRDLLARVEGERRELVSRYAPELTERMELVTLAFAELRDLIAANPQCFEKPKTLVEDGLKYGLAKRPGRVVVGDERRAVELVQKHMPEQVAMLIDRKETINKAACKGLSGAELARLGIAMVDATDDVVIRVVDGDVTKAVQTILEQAQDAER